MKGGASLLAMIALVAVAGSPAQATEDALPGGGIWPPEQSLADFNQDGVIGDADLSILLSHWGQCGVEWHDGDSSGDGCVNDDDLSLVLHDWGRGSWAAGDGAVPEPASLAALLVGGLALAHRKRR